MVERLQNSHVLFERAFGAILVHDLTNRRSEENFASRLTIQCSMEERNHNKKIKDPAAVALRVDIESCNNPVLIVGTKADLEIHRAPVSYDRLHIDTMKTIIKGSANRITLSRFFDSCLDRTRRTSMNGLFYGGRPRRYKTQIGGVSQHESTRRIDESINLPPFR